MAAQHPVTKRLRVIAQQPAALLVVGALLLLVLATIGTAIGLTAYGVGEAAGVRAGFAQSRELRAREHIIQNCTGIDSAAFENCAADALIEARETARASADLAAQQQMAFWGVWMVGVTSFQAVVGGLGLIALIGTLRHAERANAIARDDSRAWLKLDLKPVGTLAADADEITLSGFYTIENVGSGVAQHVYVDIQLEDENTKPSDPPVARLGSIETAALFPRDPRNVEFQLIVPHPRGAERLYWITLTATYLIRMAKDEPERRTSAKYYLSRAPNGEAAIFAPDDGDAYLIGFTLSAYGDVVT